MNKKSWSIWALVIGFISIIAGIFKFLAIINIPASDALVYMITGIISVCAAWAREGKYAVTTNIWLSVFYLVFGVVGSDWDHVMAGIICLIVGLAATAEKEEEEEEREVL